MYAWWEYGGIGARYGTISDCINLLVCRICTICTIDPSKVMAFQRFTQNPILHQNSKAVIDFIFFMIVKMHGLGMGDSMVIKTDEIKAEMVNHIKQNMTITLSLTLTLNHVDKYFHRVTTIYTIKKKRWRHMQAQPVIFFWDSQLGFNSYAIYFNNKQFPDGFTTRILHSSIS